MDPLRPGPGGSTSSGTISLGVSEARFPPTYGSVDDGGIGMVNRSGWRDGGKESGFPPLRRSYSLSAIREGVPTLGRHENLVAVCLLIMALLCLGIILFVLRPILIPFAVSLLFYYLLQPVVNTLNKPPAICCRELYVGCAELGAPVSDEGEGSMASSSIGGRFLSRAVGGLRRRAGYDTVASDEEEGKEGGREGGRGGGRTTSPLSTFTEGGSVVGEGGAWERMHCPRPLAVMLAIALAMGVFALFGMIIYHSIQRLQKDWPIYEMGAEQAVQRLNAGLAKLHVSLNDDLVPYLMDNLKSDIPALVSDVWVAVANG
ncbi:hypothetical protein VYU27_008788 [Nannochloropsis oceanica]